jgi:hypothetical protein
MNEPEKTTADAGELTELKEQLSGVSRQVNMLLVAAVVGSLTVTAFVGLQGRRAGRDLDVVRPQATQVVEANKKEEPVIQNFAQKLVEYGKAHPEFAPIVNRYGLATNAALTPVPLLKK